MTRVHLVFPSLWRDFRGLRSLSKGTGLSERTVHFAFPKDGPYPQLPNHLFFVAQTVAAVKDIEVPEHWEIGKVQRKYLVDHGCTGFNGVRP